MNSVMHAIFFILTFQILKSTQFPTANDNCKTPDGKYGICVNITDCQSIKSYIERNNYVFTQKQRQFLKEHACGYTEQQIKVCCPKASIVNNLDNDNFQPKGIYHTSNNVVHKNAKLLPSTCGINKNRNFTPFEAKTNNVVPNGQEAALNEFPWMVLLSYSKGNGSAFQCVGTIINERYILTAANCITSELSSVRVGEHNTATVHDCQIDDFNIIKCSVPAEDFDIEKAFCHEEFVNSFSRNDIGLIRLSKPLNIYTENVRAICLPHKTASPINDVGYNSLMLTGWGVTKKKFINQVLLKAEVSTITQKDCIRAYEKRSYDLTMSDKQFCIDGQRNGESNLCNGDTGSPVQMLNGTHYTQYGVVSIGSKICRKRQTPIVNTRVDQYLEWILNNIEP